ncbi:hypothetical protein [Pseudophaeobacter arcticus]|jgi:hypothetical protein
MQNITVINLDHPDLDDILDRGERLLWSGEPGYGRRFLQPVGDEWKIHIGLFVGALAMWGTLPFIDTEARFGRDAAVWVYGAFTIACIGISFLLACQRQYVLQNLAYLITDRRAVICRRGRNWRFGVRLYVVSCPHSDTFPYSVISNRPYPMLQVGTLLSEDLVQPFGLGLSHPGHPILWGRVTYPITLDYMPNAQTLLELVQSCARRD